MKQKSHTFVIGAMALGLAIAIFVDGAFSPTPQKTTRKVAVSGSQPTANSGKEVTPTKDEPTHEAFPSGVEEDVVAVDEKRRIKNYLEVYRKERKKEKEQEDRQMIEKINENAYLGDGSYGSKRLYLYNKAYKASRDATPLVPVFAYESDEESDSDLLELLDVIVDEDESPEAGLRPQDDTPNTQENVSSGVTDGPIVDTDGEEVPQERKIRIPTIAQPFIHPGQVVSQSGQGVYIGTQMPHI